MHNLKDDSRTLRLTPAQVQELTNYTKEVQYAQAARERFVRYLLREHDSHDPGPFELIDDCLVPASVLPKPIKIG